MVAAMVLQRGQPPPGVLSDRSGVADASERQRRGSCHSDASDASFVSADTSAMVEEVTRVIQQVDERISSIEAGHDVRRPGASAEDVAAAAVAASAGCGKSAGKGEQEPAGGWLTAQQIKDGAAILPWSASHTATALKRKPGSTPLPRPASAAPVISGPSTAQRTPRRKLPPRPQSAPFGPVNLSPEEAAAAAAARAAWEPDRSVGDLFEQYLQRTGRTYNASQRRAQFAVFCALARHRDVDHATKTRRPASAASGRAPAPVRTGGPQRPQSAPVARAGAVAVAPVVEENDMLESEPEAAKSEAEAQAQADSEPEPEPERASVPEPVLVPEAGGSEQVPFGEKACLFAQLRLHRRDAQQLQRSVQSLRTDAAREFSSVFSDLAAGLDTVAKSVESIALKERQTAEELDEARIEAQAAESSREAAFGELERLGTARGARAREALKGIRARSGLLAVPESTGDENASDCAIGIRADLHTDEDEFLDWKRDDDRECAGDELGSSESDTEDHSRGTDSGEAKQDDCDEFTELEVGEDDGTVFHYSPSGDKCEPVVAASGLLMRPQSAPALVPRLARQQQEEERRNLASTRERPNSAHRFRVVAAARDANPALDAGSTAALTAEPTTNPIGGNSQNIVQVGDVIEAVDSQLPSAVEPALLMWLSKLRLLRYAPSVAALCTSLDDVAEMDDQAIKGLALKPLEELRMVKAVKALRG